MVLNPVESTLDLEKYAEISHRCCESVCMLSESRLQKHYLDGHRPSMPGKCPWCGHGGMRHQSSMRVTHEERLGKKGFSVSFD
jgi:ribosomal protein L32